MEKVLEREEAFQGARFLFSYWRKEGNPVAPLSRKKMENLVKLEKKIVRTIMDIPGSQSSGRNQEAFCPSENEEEEGTIQQPVMKKSGIQILVLWATTSWNPGRVTKVAVGTHMLSVG